MNTCLEPITVRARTLAALRALAAVLLVCHFLFAHGCHGDEDHELFGRRAEGMPARVCDAGLNGH